MTRLNLTTTEKRRFQRNQTCPICNKKIGYLDDLTFTVHKAGRCKLYIFYHERCYNGEKEQKETTVAKT